MSRSPARTHHTAEQARTHRPLRIIASGTLFVTHTLGIPTHPAPSTAVRAHSVEHARGGSASTALSILAQFPAVDAVLVAPLSGNEEGRTILRDLRKERVSTAYCKIWEHAGVPSAWVLQSDDTDTRTVINHNPLPDITHTEFVSLLGPLLAPENYTPSPTHNTGFPSPISPPAASPSSLSPQVVGQPQPLHLLPSPRPSADTLRTHARSRPGTASGAGTGPVAPFEWLHFEGRSVKTTLQNVMGVDGLARDRRWRSRCVFSLDVGRKAKQGVEALIPHADVLFLNAHYARAHSPAYAAAPRSFLLSLLALAPPHALLVAYWGTGPNGGGAALLSVPTREYLQASGWTDDGAGVRASNARARARQQQHQRQKVRGRGANSGRGGGRAGMGTGAGDVSAETELESVRTGSSFYAGDHTVSARSGYSAFSPRNGNGGLSAPESSESTSSDEDDDSLSQSTETGDDRSGSGFHTAPEDEEEEEEEVLDEVGAHDAFVAGMIWSLSRRVLPGAPYVPAGTAEPGAGAAKEAAERGRWRLEECLKFSIELAGRKARRRGWDGLADEMARAGWLDG